MTEAPSRREQQREVRRQQILDAALAVFSQKGYQAANVSDVAAEAGVSQGTIYWYFDSKEDLLTAALLSYFGSFGEQAVASLEQYPSAAEKLRAPVEVENDFFDTGSLELARESEDGDNPYDTQTWQVSTSDELKRVDDLSAVNKERKSGSDDNPYDTVVTRKGW